MPDAQKALPAALGGNPAIQTQRPVWPVVTDGIIEAAVGALREGRLSEIFGGTYISSFEKAFREYHGSAYALALNGGTAALDSAVYAAGVRPGDEVITSTVCPAYVITPILHMNAIPVFVDVDPLTGNIDPSQIEAAVTEATKAIMVVHLSGHPADMDPIMEIARRHHLKVIEDCAHSQGSTYKGKKTGTIGQLGAFSVQAVKNLACGEGGVLLTDDPDLFERAKFVGWITGDFTLEEGLKTYFGNGLGWNYRITLLSAAIGLEQLRHFDETMALRRKNAEAISRGVSGIRGMSGTHVAPDCTHTYYDQQIRFDPELLGMGLAALVWALRAEGIGAGPIDVPVYNAGIFRDKNFYGKGCPWSCPYARGKSQDYRTLRFPNTERMQRTTVRMLLGGIISEDPAVACEHVEAFAKIASHSERIEEAWNKRVRSGESR